MKNPMPEIAAPDEPQALLPPPPGNAPPPARPSLQKRTGASTPSRSRKRWFQAAVVIAAAWLLSTSSRDRDVHLDVRTHKTRGGRGGASAVTPVVAMQAVKGNIGVYVNGLGAITPIYTVTVRSRVDGELTKSITRRATSYTRATR